MTIHLVPAPATPDDHDAYRRLHDLATYDTGCVPLTLYIDTRRGITEALTEALLLAGRAQASLGKPRRTTRADAGRLIVALQASRQDLIIFGAEHIHRADVDLFAAVADAAAVDLWLVAGYPPPAAVGAAMHDIADSSQTLEQATLSFAARPTAAGRRTPMPCEHALPLGSGTRATCDDHADAAACVIAALPHALATARTRPDAVRARLHELTMTLTPDRRWHVYASARDPFNHAVRAVEELRLPGGEGWNLRLRDVDADGRRLRLATRTVDVPAHLAAVLAAHRAIRLAEGGTPERRLLIPTDDKRTRSWAVGIN